MPKEDSSHRGIAISAVKLYIDSIRFQHGTRYKAKAWDSPLLVTCKGKQLDKTNFLSWKHTITPVTTICYD